MGKGHGQPRERPGGQVGPLPTYGEGGKMESFILTAGQLALALAGVASCVALLCIIASMLAFIVRKLRSLSTLDQ